MRDLHAKRSISVTIAGHPLTLKSDADEAYVHKLAKMVDDRVRAAQDSSRAVAVHAAALLAALQLADELEHERSSRSPGKKRSRERQPAIAPAAQQEFKE